MEMVSLKATLGLPVTQGQLYSVRMRCSEKQTRSRYQLLYQQLLYTSTQELYHLLAHFNGHNIAIIKSCDRSCNSQAEDVNNTHRNVFTSCAHSI